MDTELRQRLATLMARLAENDMAACVDLLAEFGDRIRGSVVAIARERGVRLTAADADALTVDVCTMVIPDLARSWKPNGGALPWSWGRARLGQLVDAHAGIGGRRLPPDDEWAERTDLSWYGPEPEPETVLVGLAERHPAVALFNAACAEALTAAERATLLRYELQRGAGDPSPAHTVANELAVQPTAVRQRVSRAKRKLAALAETQPRFQALADLAVLSTAPRAAAAASPSTRATQRAA